jgi:membrane-associated phospholipid phosphatase
MAFRMNTSNPASRPVMVNEWALPLFLTRENKYPAAILTFSIAIVLYLLSNHFHLFTPQLLSMSWIDDAVPFLPNSLWLYLSEYVFFIAVFALCKDMANANKYLYSFLALQIVSVAIFLVWPTTFPRDQFPLPADLNAITHFAFTSLRQTDSPASCCPSLHVSSVFLSSFIYLDDQRRKFPFFFLWAALIAVSTLTTKQHYLIDAIAGFFMAVAMYWVFHRLIPYRPYSLLSGRQAKR